MASKFFIIFLCFLFLMGFPSSSLAQNHTLTKGQPIRDWQNLVSVEHGIFKLGFFSTGSSDDRYLGIWFNQIGSANPVWVGNRNNPISDSTGELMIDATGKLQIIFNGGDPIQLYNQTTSNNVTATLQDDGNFVLREVNETEDRILWQSFDFPTDTLLPGMKLGINLKTGHKWSLNSWFSTESIPATGVFTLAGDPNGTNQLTIWWREKLYWKSGLWGTNNSFDIETMLTYDDEYNYSYISNENEKFFTYSLKNNTSFPGTSFTRWVITDRGTLIRYEIRLEDSHPSWGFDFPYGIIGPCQGIFGANSSSGCVWNEKSQCRTRKTQFEQKFGSLNPSTPTYEDLNSSLTLPDCDTMCRQNCSCSAYGVAYSNNSGCQFWAGALNLSEYNSGVYFYVDLASLTTIAEKKTWPWFLIPIIVTGVFVIILMGLYYLKRRNLKLREDKERGEYNELFIEFGGDNDGFKDGNRNGGRELQLFSFESIMTATQNFSSQNKLGQGGFGPVYKGELFTGQEIAVKRLSKSSGQGLEEFKNEIILISKLQHTNLVRLLGCCIRGEEKLLIYEYLHNKSLDFFLFDSTKRGLLDWKKRFNIIEGIAQGLLYLHRYSRVRVIHRDLKASNILLDKDMNPKISDFGMARIFTANESVANTNRVVGTYGYMSPEYAMDGIFSTKSDVFSFGVLLLEILSGRRNNSFYQSDQPLNLIGYAWELWKEGCSLNLMDPTLGSSCPMQQALRCIHVGLLCVEEKAIDRPAMLDVVSMLTNETISLHSVKQPAFSAGRGPIMTQDLPEKVSKDPSINHVSITTIAGGSRY